MSDLRKAAQAIVDRWDTWLWKETSHTGTFIDALRAALAQPEQEPVMFNGLTELETDRTASVMGLTPFQRKPLTNEEMQKLMDEEALWQFARAIEKAHGIR